MVKKTKCQIKWPSANITVRLNEGLRYYLSFHKEKNYKNRSFSYNYNTVIFEWV